MQTNYILSSPQEQIRNMIAAFFSYDNDVKVDDAIQDNHIINIQCTNQQKCEALANMLKKKYIFDKIEIDVSIHFLGISNQSNSISNANYSKRDLIEQALSNNILFNRVEIREVGDFKVYFCLLNREVIQYPNEDLTDLYFLETTLAENIAVQIFDLENVFYCTVVEESVLKEWYN